MERILDLEKKKKERTEILIRNATGKLVKSTYGVSYYDEVGERIRGSYTEYGESHNKIAEIRNIPVTIL